MITPFAVTPCKIIHPDVPVKVIALWVIKDNWEAGEYDKDLLANEWDEEELEMLGVDMSDWKVGEQNFGDTNQELDVDMFEEDMVLKISMTPDMIKWVKERLALVNASPEVALLDILGWYTDEMGA